MVESSQAVINRAELMALLQGRGVGLKDGTIPDYFEADPDAQESRGRGWYYQTNAGAWIYLGGNLDDAKKTALTAPTTQGIVGKPPKALQRTWVDVGIQYGTVLLLPAAVGATTGALRREGHELEAAAVDLGVALLGGALMEKGGSEATRRAGAALLFGRRLRRPRAAISCSLVPMGTKRFRIFPDYLRPLRKELISRLGLGFFLGGATKKMRRPSL
jgi:hypothetical protein